MTLKAKLILMVAVPLLGVAGFSINEILSQNKLSGEIDRVRVLARLSQRSSSLIHEMQKERGLSSGFLGSKGTKFVEDLPRQQEVTNLQLQQFRSFWQEFDQKQGSLEISKLIGEANERLSEIENLREGVKSQSKPVGEVLEYYSGTIGKLLNAVEATVMITPDPDMARLSTSYAAFLQAKERAGIIRAVLSNVFAKGEFTGQLFNRFSELVTQHKTYLQVFTSLSDQENREYLIEKMSDPSVTEVERMIQLAFKEEAKGKLFNRLAFEFGYSNFIHNYKNYVLRGQRKYKEQLELNLASLRKIGAELEANPDLDQGDLRNLRVVLSTVEAYGAQIPFVSSQWSKQTPVTKIDASIEIDDAPARKALEALVIRRFEVDPTHWFNEITKKINLLKEVEDHLMAGIIKKADQMQSGILLVYLLAGLVLVATLFVGVSQGRNIVALLEKLITDLRHSANEVASAADEIARSSNALSSGATQQAASLEESSASMEEMARQAEGNALAAEQTSESMTRLAQVVKKSLESSQNASLLAGKANNSAKKGMEAMENILGAMDQVKKGSDEITEIVAVISEITHQTKMLATNAAIEAARAGEHGKGFAVVADEVAKLAENSKASAKLITNLIKSNAKNTETGDELAHKGEEVLREILQHSGQVTEIMNELSIKTSQQVDGILLMNEQVETICSASKEQSLGVSQINRALEEMDKVTQSNAATSQEAAAAAEELNAQAQMLKDLVAEVSTQVGGKAAQLSSHELQVVPREHRRLRE